MILQSPGYALKPVPMVLDAAYPQLTIKNFTVTGLNGDNLDLFDGVNEGVAWLWRTKLNVKLLAKYSVADPDFPVAAGD
jgi:polar amino acid transport system substrate-binding protein